MLDVAPLLLVTVSAYCMAEEAKLKPCWVREEEVLNICPTKTVTFIQGDLVSLSTANTIYYTRRWGQGFLCRAFEDGSKVKNKIYC